MNDPPQIMIDEEFQKLVASIKEAGAILRQEMRPARMATITPSVAGNPQALPDLSSQKPTGSQEIT